MKYNTGLVETEVLAAILKGDARYATDLLSDLSLPALRRLLVAVSTAVDLCVDTIEERQGEGAPNPLARLVYVYAPMGAPDPNGHSKASTNVVTSATYTVNRRDSGESVYTGTSFTEAVACWLRYAIKGDGHTVLSAMIETGPYRGENYVWNIEQHGWRKV